MFLRLLKNGHLNSNYFKGHNTIERLENSSEKLIWVKVNPWLAWQMNNQTAPKSEDEKQGKGLISNCGKSGRKWKQIRLKYLYIW